MVKPPKIQLGTRLGSRRGDGDLDIFGLRHPKPECRAVLFEAIKAINLTKECEGYISVYNLAPLRLNRPSEWSYGIRVIADGTTLSYGGLCNRLGRKENISYAFNSYYQVQTQYSQSCDFDGLEIVTFLDPSVGECRFLIEIIQNTSSATKITILFLKNNEMLKPFPIEPSSTNPYLETLVNYALHLKMVTGIRCLIWELFVAVNDSGIMKSLAPG